MERPESVISGITPALWDKGIGRGSAKEVEKFRTRISNWEPQTNLHLGDARRYTASTINKTLARMGIELQSMDDRHYPYEHDLYDCVNSTNVLFLNGRHLHAAHFLDVIIEFEEYEVRRKITDDQYDAWCAGDRDDEELANLRDMHAIRDGLIVCYKEQCAKELEAA